MPNTPTQAESNAASMAAQTALTDAANLVFINAATAIIADAVSQGKYEVFLSHVRHVSFKDVRTYFNALGYKIGIPRCPSWEFGYFYPDAWPGWYGYFADRQICACGKQCKILISWQNPPSGFCGPVPWPGNCGI